METNPFARPSVSNQPTRDMTLDSVAESIKEHLERQGKEWTPRQELLILIGQMVSGKNRPRTSGECAIVVKTAKAILAHVDLDEPGGLLMPNPPRAFAPSTWSGARASRNLFQRLWDWFQGY